jgi:hypothetical protein
MMLPLHEIENFLQHMPAHLQEIVLELRNIIVAVSPDAVEVVRWGDLGYFHAGCGGLVSAGICQVEIRKDHVRLAFIHGAFLLDPHGLLKGTQKAKRFVRIESYNDAPWEYLQELIVSSSKFDPRSLGE